MNFPRIHRAELALVATLVALAASCSSAPERAQVAGLGAPPSSGAGFEPTGSADGIKYAASYVIDHAEVFGDDLVDEEGILPVALQIGMDVRSDRDARWPDGASLQLFLPDGTVCLSVPPEDIATGDRDLHDRVRESALRRGWLEDDFGRVAPAFAYFRLPEFDAYSASAGTITLGEESSQRTLRLAKSLVSFRLLLDDEGRTYYVGLGSEPWRVVRGSTR